MAEPVDQLVALRERQDAFEASIPLVPSDTPVPWGGDWVVRDLVVHLAEVHHWAAAKAARRPEPPLDLVVTDLVALYASCAEGLRTVLAGLDPDAPSDTLLDDGLPEDRRAGTVRFWHRRQALETLVHLWDLRTAGGLPFEPGAVAWADCLDEVVTVMHPRQLRLGRIPAPSVRVRLVATDADADHVLAGSPDVAEAGVLHGSSDAEAGGVLHGSSDAEDGGVLHGSSDAREVVVRGPVRSLALLAWGRLAPTDPGLEISGDAAALDAVLARGLTP
ncbi:MAG: maleylpyruvate isomerase N-terminal domain-containing protein [Propionicimonas sp.]|uniref:maleylpyruvate isomerase N-terminal domain-containing protein n=1 Tax=Propionicimonas sp. TaxID=1955623 RepID=UPI003D12F5F3